MYCIEFSAKRTINFEKRSFSVISQILEITFNQLPYTKARKPLNLRKVRLLPFMLRSIPAFLRVRLHYLLYRLNKQSLFSIKIQIEGIV